MMKRFYFLALFPFLLTACSGSNDYDGLWLIDKDKSTAACLIVLQNDQEKEVSEDGNTFAEGLFEGFSKFACEGVVGMIPVLDIKNNKFSYSILQMSAKCTINPEKNTVSCLPDQENKVLAEEGEGISMPKISGEMKVEEDFLVWNMAQQDQDQAKEFKLFYKLRQ